MHPATLSDRSLAALQEGTAKLQTLTRGLCDGHHWLARGSSNAVCRLL